MYFHFVCFVVYKKINVGKSVRDVEAVCLYIWGKYEDFALFNQRKAKKITLYY